MRIILDTNVFVSMVLGGLVGEINDRWMAGSFTLLVSDAILSEYLDVLQRPKLHLAPATISVIISRIYRKAEFVIPTEQIDIVKSDPSDNKFLEAALAGRAIYIVSGDSHLLKQKTFRDIEIITAREFLERLD
jgi:uncharacterized protein